jgi:hypothetical protein
MLPLRAGNLPTMNGDPYPGLGAWWVNVRCGEVGRSGGEVFARVYGSTPREARARAVALCSLAATQPQAEPVASGSAVLDGLLRSGLALSAKEAATNDKLPKWARDRFAMCARALEKDAAPQPQGADAATLAKRLDKVLGCYADSMPKEAYSEVDAVMRALNKAATQPQSRPQASAEDVARVRELVRQSGLAGPTIKAAWQRIEADYERMGVVK